MQMWSQDVVCLEFLDGPRWISAYVFNLRFKTPLTGPINCYADEFDDYLAGRVCHRTLPIAATTQRLHNIPALLEPWNMHLFPSIIECIEFKMAIWSGTIDCSFKWCSEIGKN